MEERLNVSLKENLFREPAELLLLFFLYLEERVKLYMSASGTNYLEVASNYQAFDAYMNLFCPDCCG